MVKKKVARSKPKKTTRRSKRTQLSRDLELMVGADVYGTWLRMLRELVPCGRTHRLAVLVAGMLQYAWSCKRKANKENTVAQLLDESAKIGMDYDEQTALVTPLIEQLFKDADVKWKRKNARGQGYSIAEQSLEEFLRWDFMPWE